MRIVVRYEYHTENFIGMAQLGCAIIPLRIYDINFSIIEMSL
jgi:hypothetical protein